MDNAVPEFDTQEEVDRWNSRARYLQGISKETEAKILAKVDVLMTDRPTGRALPLESAMDLAIHQQRLVDWMMEHPRNVKDCVALAATLTPDALERLKAMLDDRWETQHRVVIHATIYEVYGDAPHFTLTKGDNTYCVDSVNQTCTCPDFTFRGRPCKHVLGLLPLLEKRPQ